MLSSLLWAALGASGVYQCMDAKNNQDSEYSVTLRVGAQGHTMQVAPDTGSFDPNMLLQGLRPDTWHEFQVMAITAAGLEAALSGGPLYSDPGEAKQVLLDSSAISSEVALLAGGTNMLEATIG